MLYLLLSISSSVIIALLLKYNETQERSRLVPLASNYITAMGITCYLWWHGGSDSLGSISVFLGIVTGIFFVVGFLLMMISIGRIGIAIPVSLMRLAVALPIVVSIVFYGETTSGMQILGLVLALICFLLFGRSASQEEASGVRVRDNVSVSSPRGGWLLLIGLFLCMGFGGISMKVRDEHCPIDQMHGFLTILFGMALILSWVIVIAKKEQILGRDVCFGLILGVPNGLSSIFFILALHKLGGFMVFPVNDVGVVVFSSLAAMVIWREKLNQTGWVALAVAIVAIVLMNLG